MDKIGEFGLIERIKGEFAALNASCGVSHDAFHGISHGASCGVVGIGDDCAVIPQFSGYDTLVSTDMLVEGTHFLRDDISPRQLGWKSAVVNISDIAAMGGSPVGSFLSLAIPKDLDNNWINEFICGYASASRHYDFPLLGGDTTSSDSLMSICVTVLGRIESGKAKLRSQAQEGDYICVTGPLGDSGLGLDAVMRRRRAEVLPDCAQPLIERHYQPFAQLQAGQRLASTEGVHAMMDISDGIASDLRHILAASGHNQTSKETLLGAEIYCDRLPISAEARKYAANFSLVPEYFALCSGEDYQLLFTASEQALSLLDIPYHIVGKIIPATPRQIGSLGPSCDLNFRNLPASLDPKSLFGYRHF